MTIGLQIVRWAGLLLHLPMLPLFYVQGLVLPTEGVVGLIVMWIVLLVVAVLLWKRAPLLIALVPVADVALIYGVTWVGRNLLGWHV